VVLTVVLVFPCNWKDTVECFWTDTCRSLQGRALSRQSQWARIHTSSFSRLDMTAESIRRERVNSQSDETIPSHSPLPRWLYLEREDKDEEECHVDDAVQHDLVSAESNYKEHNGLKYKFFPSNQNALTLNNKIKTKQGSTISKKLKFSVFRSPLKRPTSCGMSSPQKPSNPSNSTEFLPLSVPPFPTNIPLFPLVSLIVSSSNLVYICRKTRLYLTMDKSSTPGASKRKTVQPTITLLTLL